MDIKSTNEKILGLLTDYGSYLIPFLLIICVSVLYYVTGYNGPTYFDLFVKFADKMLHGVLWFDEDLRIYDFAPVDGKYFVVQPPFPAILLIPLVKIFGIQLSQNLVSIILGSIASAVTYGIARRLNFSKLHSVFISILFSFGTLIWYLSVVGSTWYFSHVVAVLFMQLAIFEALGKQRGFIMGLLWGAAFFSRLTTILGIPFLCSFILFSNREKKDRIRQLIMLMAGFGIFFITDISYNYYRYDTPMDISLQYWYDREYEERGEDIKREFSHGLFSNEYIPRHIDVMFKKLPKFESEFPYFRPSGYGMAIWAFMPFMIFIFLAPLRDHRVKVAWICMIANALVIMRYASVGQSQFGYRYSSDYLPLIFFLFLMSLNNRIRVWHYAVGALAMLVNLWGVLGHLKLGWGTW